MEMHNFSKKTLKKHKQLLFFLCFLLVVWTTSSVIAQSTFNVSGKVTLESGETLIGASVLVRGTNQGTITDIDGRYSLILSNQQAMLVISYLGCITQEILVDGRHVIDVILREQSNVLEDVVVVGYGISKKKDLTGAVANVRSEQIVQIPVVTAAEALQGRVAGLDVTRGNGDAGSGVTIRLRGNRSVSDNKSQLAGYNEPLTIVDGMQGVSLKDIPPSDILSIDVLKDAASAAIYGARGANGIIIVTTKSGQTGRPRLSVNSYYGISNVASYGDYMNTHEYVAYQIERNRGITANAANGWLGVTKTAEEIFTPDQMSKIDAGNDTYFPGIVLQTGFQQEHNFNLSAGTEQTKIYFSGSIYDEEGILKRDHYRRYTGRMNIDQTVFSWLDAGMRMQIAYSDNDKRQDPMNVARRIPPFETLYDDDGNLIPNPANIGSGANPLLDEDPVNWQNNIYGTRFSGAFYIDIKPLKGLSLRSNLGVSTDNTVNGLYYSPNSVKAITSTSYKDGGTQKSQSDYRRFQWENILTYSNIFADIHNLTLTGIQSVEKSVSTGMSFPDATPPRYPTMLWYETLTNSRGLEGNFVEREYASLAGRANYILLDKYIFNASMRYDASSKVNGNWASFPSVGAAWRLSEESFIRGMREMDFLSNLKLRGSWGVSGNDNATDYISQTMLSQINNFTWDGTVTSPAYRLSDLIGNKNLTWERTTTFDLGVDLGLFDNRVHVTFDYYDAKTTNLLAIMQIPSIAGGARTYKNFGRVSNKGYELLIETFNIKNKNFSWNTTFTFAQNKEEIVSLPGDQSITSVQFSRDVLIIGYPVEVLYGYRTDGVWQIDEVNQIYNDWLSENPGGVYTGVVPGDVKFLDSEGLPTRTPSSTTDRVVIGKIAPDFYGSLSNDFYYKGLDLNIFAIFRHNFWYASDFVNKYEPNSEKNNGPHMDYWTPENPSGTFARPGTTGSKNTPEKAHALTFVNNSFFKIKNITLGYTLPTKISNRISINKLRFWASAKNMFIWQKDPAGFDPENVNNLGELMTDHPLNKLVTFGLNVEF